MPKSVVVVGVGALGSHLVQFLRNEDVSLTVIDFDRVEAKNVSSQFHARNSVGKSKVAGIKQSMSFLFGSKLEVIPHRLTTDNVSQLLGRADLVVDCLDNAESRQTVQKFCMDKKIPCLHGALDAAGNYGRVQWTAGKNVFSIDTEPADGAATCEDGRFLPFIVTVSGYMARAAQVYLNDGKVVGFNIHPCGATIL